ncbi:tetratricopeptide repeat protein [Amycolatopsis vastitatis]|uniref:tetratricopeptide repeat protein n=1 Tax=Amycolatopsis vastitatis TaxID=1905142 RepID=UPI0011786BEF|nr:tetratricopeptide repeat protein [Amycolatopsis vastitatis]
MAIRFGAANWLLVSSSPVRNVLEGLSWPAAILAVLLAVPWRRRKQRKEPFGPYDTAERVSERAGGEVIPASLRERLLHVKCGRLPLVEQVGLLELRVKRAIERDAQSPGPDMPAYVGRDVDTSLDEVVEGGGIVLLHGRAATGKTRIAAEAVRRCCPEHTLVVPVDGPALRELASTRFLEGDVVLWLDDLERFLTPGGLDLGVLQKLCAEESTRVVVVATIRDQQLAKYETARLIGEQEFDRAAADLVAAIPPERRIRVGQDLTRTESKRAQLLRTRDTRIGHALKAIEGFAEYLAAGRAMMDRWSIGDGPAHHCGAALISGAVDCRRAGYNEPVPGALLCRIQRHYLQPSWRDRADLPSAEEALRWAVEPVLGASSCLQPRADDLYLAPDYLLDRAQAGDSPLGTAKPPVQLWPELLQIAVATEAFNIGVSAHSLREPEVAITAFRQAVEGGFTSAHVNLGVLLESLQRDEEAAIEYTAAAEAGHSEGLLNLGLLRHKQGDLDDAVQQLQAAVDAGSREAEVNLAVVLAERGRSEEAEAAFRSITGSDETAAKFGLEHLKYERRRQKARAGTEPTENELRYRRGGILHESGSVAAAELAYRAAAEAGLVDARLDLALLLHEQRRVAEAEVEYRAVIGAGRREARFHLARLLETVGRSDEAHREYVLAAEAGAPSARYYLARMLWLAGRAEEAEEQVDLAAEFYASPSPSTEVGDAEK